MADLEKGAMKKKGRCGGLEKEVEVMRWTWATGVVRTMTEQEQLQQQHAWEKEWKKWI